MDVTRRALARIIAATAIITLDVSAQAPAESAEQKMKTALSDIKIRAQRMNSVHIPPSTEPAFRFRP